MSSILWASSRRQRAGYARNKSYAFADSPKAETISAKDSEVPTRYYLNSQVIDFELKNLAKRRILTAKDKNMRSETLESRVLKRISRKRGDVFLHSDFEDLGGYDQVGVCFVNWREKAGF